MTARQFKAAIKKLGISQRSYAKHLGVNERTVRRWVSGKTKVPPLVAFAVKMDLAGKS